MLSMSAELYVYHWGWLTVSLCASGGMLLASIAAVIFNHATICPDILGHCSTMTKDNSHIKLPAGGSTLDGMDRARLLNLKVRIGRVGNNGDSVVGRISVASFDSADRLVKNGLYF